MSTKTVYNTLRNDLARTAVTVLVGWGMVLPSFATTRLGDKPVFADIRVPGNVALALSVEFPTVNRASYPSAAYSSANEYLGYFDPKKCYLYNYSANEIDRHFYPQGLATNRTCVGANDNKWSGNYLNWATGQAIDSFRWTMTGGNRSTDTEGTAADAAVTILQKAWHSGQGNYFPDKSLPAAEIAGATPFTGATFNSRIQGQGFGMRFSVGTPAAGSFTGRYYNRSNTNFNVVPPDPTTPTLTRTDAEINFDWGNGSPGTGVNADNVVVVWEGTFIAPETGNFRFQTRSDDGVRLRVNGNLLIDRWVDQGPTNYETNDIALTQGNSFTVRLEYYERSGGAVAQLNWRTPSNSTYGVFRGGATPAGNLSNASVDYNSATVVAAGTVYDAKIRVKVCDPSGSAGDGTAGSGLEENCVRYGTNAKPEGLVQKYANQMRFSAIGYLNDPSMLRDGGVLRASQKFVGPTEPRPGAPEIDNLQQEWSPTTGVILPNPNGDDAANTQARFPGATVSNSGVMNYLNKFGQISPSDYKSFDPVSEMYYAAQRYLRGLENVSAYTDIPAIADRQRFVDGFPVITDWTVVQGQNDRYRKPAIQYYCQKNFILGIGDIYTHRDKNLPGNDRGPNARYGTEEPPLPNAVSSDSAVDAIAATNKVGVLQGLGATLGATNNYSGRNNSAGIAGLAYWANTNDIRPDMERTQTIKTYWVDVLENPFEANNQFLLAAKFGGFDVLDNYSYDTNTTALADNLWTDGDLINTSKRPRNYFTAGDPKQMRDGLTAAFEKLSADIEAFTTSFSVALPQTVASGNDSYSSEFNADGWTGEVSAVSLAFDLTTNKAIPTPSWKLSERLAAQLAGEGWDKGEGSRKVITKGATGGVPFRRDALTATQRAALDSPLRTGDDSQDVLNYLRGQRDFEVGSTAAVDADSKRYRARTNGLLGDIVNSKLVPVGSPNFPLSDSTNPGYSEFKNTVAYKDRLKVVYFGANDGMVHAVDGRTNHPDGGKELFAYVPSSLFSGPTGTPAVNGLVALANPRRDHYFYVDATPRNADIDLNNTHYLPTETRPLESDGVTPSKRWRTVLIGGMGKGGKAYYALDITDSTAMTDETEAQTASRLLWEFTDADMGYSFGSPVTVKTKKYGWVVILTSGYNNANGQGYFFIVNPRTGALLEKISTGVGSPTDQAGLAHANAFVRDLTDGTADAAYAGDLKGNVWRLDMSSDTAAFTLSPRGAGPAAPMAVLTDASGQPQPVTTPPFIEAPRGSNRRVVTIGTGRLLDASDIDDAQPQSFYAIRDGFVAGFSTSLPASLSFPITRSNLEPNTDLTKGVDVAADKLGWYVELGLGAGPRGWRVVSLQDTANGLIAFASTLPGGGSECSPSGTSRLYSLDLNNGGSSLTNTTGEIIAFQDGFDGVLTDVRFLSVDGTARILAGTDKGELSLVNPNRAGAGQLQRINWRELPLIN
jgi:type IV pilus assembly protein PilY1